MKTRIGDKGEKGGFALGLIIGLLIGLALALAVALYVTKVPVPFVNKVPQRTAEQDAAEIERNKNWDPNAPLGGKAVRIAPAASAGSVASAPAAVRPIEAPVTETKASAPKPVRDPAAILAGQAPAASAAKSAKATPETFSYFVQAGAFARTEDAEQQRAKLAMMGLAAKVTEREQSGRTVFRVRLGPYEHKEEADAAQERLQSSGVEAALVRVENLPR